MPLSAPANVRSSNVGNGNMEVRWDAVGGAVSYNIYIATSLSGQYVLTNKHPITNTKGLVLNLPFNTVVYTKVAAVDSGGVVGALSSAADDGYCVRAQVTLAFTGPVGDIVNIGSLFAEFVGDGNLIAFRTLASGTI